MNDLENLIQLLAKSADSGYDCSAFLARIEYFFGKAQSPEIVPRESEWQWRGFHCHSQFWNMGGFLSSVVPAPE